MLPKELAMQKDDVVTPRPPASRAPHRRCQSESRTVGIANESRAKFQSPPIFQSKNVQSRILPPGAGDLRKISTRFYGKKSCRRMDSMDSPRTGLGNSALPWRTLPTRMCDFRFSQPLFIEWNGIASHRIASQVGRMEDSNRLQLQKE